jgi:threonine synthase
MALPGKWRWPFQCVSCGMHYPEEGFPYCCTRCGSVFDFVEPLQYEPHPECDLNDLNRFRNSFPLPADAELITLGEGNTPLVPVDFNGRRVYLKCEHLNPTGSFKDRGTVVLVSAMHHMGVQEAVEDSSGNAGASFAAYAARAGVKACVFIPEYASGPKRMQIEAYGAEVISVPGPRSASTKAALEAVERGAIYASHAYLPHGLAGMATIAYELFERLGGAPGSVVTPVGQGTLLIGLMLGFQALFNSGKIGHLPQLIAVQARACAPLWELHSREAPTPVGMGGGETVAEGIRILNPLRAKSVIDAVEKSRGEIIAVEEDEILDGWKELGRQGFYVEPTSAVVWPALWAAMDRLQDPVVAVLTGSGLKSDAS